MHNNDQIHDPARLCKAMLGLNFAENVTDPAEGIKSYCADVFERPEAIGCEECETKNRKHTIEILLVGALPMALESAIEESVKVETGLEKNV